ncbi:MAG TPA: hypothetical protein PLU10_10550 [Chitinophagaceae bacterium]|nr:hypothetical protein [Chitinophagaceae bacterium]
MKTIPFIVLILLAGYGATSQDNQKLYLLQYNHYYFTAKTYDNQQVMETTQKGFPIGLQVVTRKGNVRAQRIGVTFTENQLLSPIPETNSSTSTNHFISYKLFAPTFTFGQEWQYQVFRPLMLYLGAELGVGLMRNSYKSHEEIAGPGYYSYSSSENGYAFNVNAMVNPFVGARVVLPPFVMGYEFSSPIRYAHVFNGPTDFSHGQFMHRFYIGYVNKLHEGNSRGCQQRF